MRDSTKSFTSVLLPVFISEQLVCHKEFPGQISGFTWKLYEFLSVPMQAQQEAQNFLGPLLDTAFVLPQKPNSAQL